MTNWKDYKMLMTFGIAIFLASLLPGVPDVIQYCGMAMGTLFFVTGIIVMPIEQEEIDEFWKPRPSTAVNLPPQGEDLGGTASRVEPKWDVAPRPVRQGSVGDSDRDSEERYRV